MPNELTFRNMTRPEVDDLVDWAALEGWNPGLHDADTFWATDPDAYLAAELDGELIGGGATTSYGGEFGFMGFFIVRPEFRGRGLGNELWHTRLQRLHARLAPGASIGMDGVFAMQDYYAKGGFVLSHRNLRFASAAPDTTPSTDNSTHDDHIVALASLPFGRVEAYDRTCFPAPRPGFLSRWITQPDALAIGYLQDDDLRGYAVARRCRDGCKIGPLFADDPDVADVLFARLARFARGGSIFLDAPENNPAAMRLVRRHGMTEVFGCARMYVGSFPDIAHERVFGVTTFELG